MEKPILTTEGRNPRSMHIDKMTTEEMLRCINAEDHAAVAAVEAEIGHIAPVVERIADGFRRGGRLIYAGCGTSGRLGVLDASECPPTYGTDPEQVIGVIAGGDRALRNAAEGAEDSYEAGKAALEALNLRPADTLVCLSAAGGAAYVLGAADAAKAAGAATVALTCNPDTPLEAACQYAITPLTGPEVVTGSTRMKAGTAQKLVLNMLSTCAMIQTGKVRENLMIHMRPTNRKLHQRALRMLGQLTGCKPEEAEEALRMGGDIPAALALLEQEK